MDNLFMIFIVQVVLWILVFFLICYFANKNARLKKEIKLLKETSEKKGEGV